MEEKRPGQQPEADRASGSSQGVTTRPGGKADGGLTPTERDLELVKQADEASADLDENMKRDGFGDHKGVDGFPAIDR